MSAGSKVTFYQLYVEAAVGTIPEVEGEQSRAEQSREQSGKDQSRAERNRTEQNRTEQSREQSRAEQIRAEQGTILKQQNKKNPLPPFGVTEEFHSTHRVCLTDRWIPDGFP